MVSCSWSGRLLLANPHACVASLTPHYLSKCVIHSDQRQRPATGLSDHTAELNFIKSYIVKRTLEFQIPFPFVTVCAALTCLFYRPPWYPVVSTITLFTIFLDSFSPLWLFVQPLLFGFCSLGRMAVVQSGFSQMSRLPKPSACSPRVLRTTIECRKHRIKACQSG